MARSVRRTRCRQSATEKKEEQVEWKLAASGERKKKGRKENTSKDKCTRRNKCQMAIETKQRR